MRRALLVLLLATASVSTHSVAWASDFEEGAFRSSTPDETRQLVDRALAGLELPPPPRDAFDLRRAQALARRTLEETLAAEGWFTPEIRIDDDGQALRVDVRPGPRTRIVSVDLEFRGALAGDAPDAVARRELLREAWGLKVGEPFRQAEWAASKRRLLNGVLGEDFAAAELVETEAEIEAETARARLRVVVDSGPAFRFGELEIEGLSRYDRRLVERYSAIRPGAPYRAEQVLALQAALQNTPYFSSVNVEIDRDPALAGAVPIRIRVTEAQPKRLSFGAGFSSNTGARVETTWRHTDFLNRAWTLETGVRVEQRRQAGFATLRLPVAPSGWNDSLVVIAENSDISDLTLRRLEAALTRGRITGSLETRYSLNVQREGRKVPLEDEEFSSAVTLNGSWTWRNVDSVTDPRRGTVLNLQVGGGTRKLLSDQDFLRTLVRAQRFVPFGARDTLTFRALLGNTFAPSREGIPQSFLFRTGGSQTVRGFGFERLGVREGGAVVGGRFLAVAGAEWLRWFDDRWGGAAFVDVGDAADSRGGWDPAVGVGAGVRFRSPVGPLALDVARGSDPERGGRWRLHFSIAVAF